MSVSVSRKLGFVRIDIGKRDCSSAIRPIRLTVRLLVVSGFLNIYPDRTGSRSSENASYLLDSFLSPQYHSAGTASSTEENLHDLSRMYAQSAQLP
jgi:hypothetical protein